MAKDLKSGKIITPGIVARLKEHKYSCDIQSILEPYMQPFWNKVVTFLPLWLAPNLVTLIGLVINITTTTILISHSSGIGAREQLPTWVYLQSAFGIFMYQTLDAIDGKQARRTKTASVLGELFDHGCDSVTTIFVIVGCCVAIQMDSDFQVITLVFLTLVNFYIAHWRAYVTGRLTFRKVDVTEAHFMMMAIYVITAIAGGDIWHINIAQWLSLPLSFTTADLLYTFTMFAQISTLWDHGNQINKNGVGAEGTSVADTSFLAPLFPLAAYLFSFYHILAFGIEPKSFMFLFGAGFAVSKITNKLILGHMSKSPLPQSDITLLIPFLFTINHQFDFGFDNEFLMLVSTTLYALSLLAYSVTVCLELSQFLDIPVLTIRPPKELASSDH